MTRLKKNWRSKLSTIVGAIVAVATAWSTIDFSTFVFSKDWKMLIIPAVIALGGYMTKVKGGENASN